MALCVESLKSRGNVTAQGIGSAVSLAVRKTDFSGLGIGYGALYEHGVIPFGSDVPEGDASL